MALGSFQSFNVLLTRIVGIHYYPEARTIYGRRVHFRREPENPHDANAIAAFNGRGARVGYLPRTVSAWLAPIVDAGWVRLGGLANDAERDGAIESVLIIRARPEIQTLLGRVPGRNCPAFVHGLLADLWRDQEAYAGPDFDEILNALRLMMKNTELQPETQFLYHMLRGRSDLRMIRRDRRYRARVRHFLAGLRFGDPLGWAEAALLPIFPADSPGAPPSDAPPALLLPIEGGRAGALQQIPTRIVYPEGAHGFLALSHGRFGGFFWFERAEFARINWMPGFLAILQAALREVEIGCVQIVEPVVIRPAEQRRELMRWWGGRHAFYREDGEKRPDGLRVCEMIAGLCSGHMISIGENVLRLVLLFEIVPLFLPGRVEVELGSTD